ncbi:hypothetical protein VVR26_04220 [Corynebacterium camporealensis]|uniref:hypothetical protein n=1 Tax=Corynebacterium camporealensis TaxID=161896 RepID=UPI0034CDC3D7
MRQSIYTTLAALTGAALLITSCSSPDNNEAASDPTNEAGHAHEHEHDHEHDHDHAAEGQEEVAELPTRLIFTHDGGVTTLDDEGKVLEESELPGFLRINNAGDDRHALVTQGDKFRLYDSGLVTKPHGDHNHYFVQEPTLDDATFNAPHAGHVVHHDGYTALFADGSGVAEIYKTDELAEGKEPLRTVDTGAPHHGVAVPLEDGSVVVTKGTEDERHTIQHLDEDGEVLSETTKCPGVHGEAAAGNGHIFFGCEDGPVVFDGKEFHKVDVSEYAGAGGYQRSGNAAGSEESDVILADNKTEEDAEFERPESVALINTADNTARTVDLGSSYWFRSLARGPLGEGLVLTYDGNLNIIDPDTGEIEDKVKAIDEWKEKEEWQQPGPILKSADGYAYITDAENQELVVVDLHKREVTKRIELDFQPTEMAVL